MSDEHDEGFDVHQDEDKVASGTVARLGVLAIVVTVASVGIAWALLGKDQAKLGGGPAEITRKTGMVAPPTVGIIEQTLIENERRGIDQRQAEEVELHQYGWVDRAHGVAHIPIEQAMDLVLAQNAREGAQDARDGGSAAGEGGPP